MGRRHIEGIFENWDRFDQKLQEVGLTTNELIDPNNKNMYDGIRERRNKTIKNFNLY